MAVPSFEFEQGTRTVPSVKDLRILRDLANTYQVCINADPNGDKGYINRLFPNGDYVSACRPKYIMNEYWRILGTDPLSVWDGKGRSPTRDEVQDHIERIGQLIWEIWIRYEQEQNWVGDISSRTQATLGRRDVYSELQKQEEEGHLSHGERDIASTLASYLKSPESLEQVEGHLAHDITDGDTKKSKGNSQPMPQLEAGKTGFDLVALRIRSACEAYQDGWNMVEATEDGYGISAVEKGFEGDLEGSALKGEGNADWEFCG